MFTNIALITILCGKKKTNNSCRFVIFDLSAVWLSGRMNHQVCLFESKFLSDLRTVILSIFFL